MVLFIMSIQIIMSLSLFMVFCLQILVMMLAFFQCTQLFCHLINALVTIKEGETFTSGLCFFTFVGLLHNLKHFRPLFEIPKLLQFVRLTILVSI